MKTVFNLLETNRGIFLKDNVSSINRGFFLNRYKCRSSNKNIDISTGGTNTPSFKSIQDVINFVKPKDPNSWVIIQDENTSLNKNLYIKNLFQKQFPNVTLPDELDEAYKLITNLASRSLIISEWLRVANLQYSDVALLPSWLSNYTTPSEYRNLQSTITDYNMVSSEESREATEAAEEYKKKLNNIREKYKKQRMLFKTQSKMLVILTLPTNKLPISIQLAIENYTPAKIENAPNAKVYTRELLTNYKIFLLQKLKQDPTIDIEQLINDNTAL